MTMTVTIMHHILRTGAPLILRTLELSFISISQMAKLGPREAPQPCYLVVRAGFSAHTTDVRVYSLNHYTVLSFTKRK